ncbi:hypothetical protein SUGI_1224820 [Cryptomeria japonica]|uniref:Uncharacterized protein n=1 Tax=Cryptomeria japonica TaxID=3369 RepID=A0AAD3RPR1_CRYJA|nr:hypothetical protein SUGI_1224820 [Cryptomeria japonica]
MISGRPPERVNFHRVFIPLNSLGGAPTILKANLPAAEPTGDPLGMPILIDTYFPSILGISFLPRQTMEGGMNLSGQGRSRLIFMKIFLSPCLPPHR